MWVKVTKRRNKQKIWIRAGENGQRKYLISHRRWRSHVFSARQGKYELGMGFLLPQLTAPHMRKHIYKYVWDCVPEIYVYMVCLHLLNKYAPNNAGGWRFVCFSPCFPMFPGKGLKYLHVKCLAENLNGYAHTLQFTHTLRQRWRHAFALS